MASILLIDVLNHFFAAAILEIHINVWWLRALGGEKAFEQQLCMIGTHFCYPKAITDCRVSGRAATLTINVLIVREANNLMHCQKEMFIGELFYQPHLMFDKFLILL